MLINFGTSIQLLSAFDVDENNLCSYDFPHPKLPIHDSIADAIVDTQFVGAISNIHV